MTRHRAILPAILLACLIGCTSTGTRTIKVEILGNTISYTDEAEDYAVGFDQDSNFLKAFVDWLFNTERTCVPEVDD